MPDIAEPEEADRNVPWFALWQEAGDRLAAAGVPNAMSEARWLVEEVSGLGHPVSYDGFAVMASREREARLDALVERRLAGEPVQYVLGHWPFRHLDLVVDPRVLIPRAETEEVCGHALGEVDRIAGLADRPPGPVRVLDLGTGSGALALAIAYERRNTEVWATERSADALEVARTNLAAAGGAAPRVHLFEGSWFEPLPAELEGTVDVLVSNPPYVAHDDQVDNEVMLWEPHEALFPVPEHATGFEAIDEILEIGFRWLAPHGSVVLEIGDAQGQGAEELAAMAGFREITVFADLAGKSRALVARRSSTANFGPKMGSEPSSGPKFE